MKQATAASAAKRLTGGKHRGSAHGMLTGSVLAVAIALLLAGGVPLQAQPNLNFKRVTVNWPTIELYISVGCNGNPAYNMTKQNFRIFENGVEVKDFTLWCPDPTIRCAISVALVFDASGSMSGSGNAGAKAGGHAFIDIMDGVVDEATIIWFNDRVTVYQQMTTVKPMLHAAVDALPASGATAVWDGIYTGIIELINNGVNMCRNVIVVTDGADNSSTRTVAEIITLANRHRIRVFTIGIGASINATELEMIALLTGGRYYQTPNAGQLAAIMMEIGTVVFQGFQECFISYGRDCADGGMRTVELQLDFCNGTDVKTKTYRAPLDTTTFTDLRMELGSVNTTRGGTAVVPLDLVTPMNGAQLYPMGFTLLFDETCLQLVTTQTPPGSLLENVPITVTPVPGGVRVQTTDRKIMNKTGTMMEFVFQTGTSGNISCCPVTAVDPTIEQGCFLPEIDSALVCVLPPAAESWVCSVDIPQIAVDTAAQRYSPMPFTVNVTVTNTGTVDLDSMHAVIDFQTGLSFSSPDSPATADKAVLPEPIPPGELRTVNWRLEHPKSIVPRDYSIRVLVYGPRDTSVCMATLHIPAFILPPLRYALTADGPLKFCEGDSVTLDGGDYARWAWSTIKDTTRYLTVRDPGSYFCVAIDTGGRVMVSDTVQVITYPAPQPVIAVLGSIPICEGDSVRLEVRPLFPSYRWNTGDSTSSILVRTEGIYHATVTNAQGCTGYSDTILVAVIPAPPKPVITRNGDVLLSPPAAGYQWLRNELPISGARSQFYVAATTGSYRVRVTNAEGCSALSDPFDVSVLDAGGVPAVVRSFDVYPDPTHGTVTIDLRLERSCPVTVIVRNALGQEVSRIESGQPVRDFHRRFEVGSVPGAYFLQVSAGDESWMRRILRVQ